MPMKKNLLFFIGLMLVMFSMVSLSRASVVGWGDNYIVQKDSQINSNLYVGGQQITLMGPVFGDVMGGGGNVFVNNTIQGDAMFLGGTVNVVSTVNRNLRIAAATIVVSGKVGGDLAA